ncbi:MAG: TIGR03435 family protein [Bryobacteraceae bacterium]
MKPWTLWACAVWGCAAFGQQPAGKPAFEVASIKPSQPMGMGKMRIGMSSDAGMLRYTNVSLKECIRTAYRVKDFQVQGPDWIGGARFDIVAKFPAGASEDDIPEMLQALLAERFKLKLHRDTKEHSIYALVAAKDGPKLKAAEVAVEGDPGKGTPPRNVMMIQVDGAGAHLKAPSATLATLAEMMSRFSERPVLDMTGIKGRYDFDLVFSPETMRGGPGGMVRMGPPPGEANPAPRETASEPAGSIYDSVRPYGLKLEPRRAQMEILVIDHIEKEPTEN